jgi:DNA-binding transcriptional ArsR family regulator
MSKQTLKRRQPARIRKIDARKNARRFAALGDETRLRLLSRLGVGSPKSITDLTTEFPMTRQAVTKHLRVLEDAEFVTQQTSGREHLYSAAPAGIAAAQAALEAIAQQWDASLLRLKNFIENNP